MASSGPLEQRRQVFVHLVNSLFIPVGLQLLSIVVDAGLRVEQRLLRLLLGVELVVQSVPGLNIDHSVSKHGLVQLPLSFVRICLLVHANGGAAEGLLPLALVATLVL